jgi:hypothetical protein
LEGKEIDVEEDNLRDQDVVTDGERSSEDTLGGGLGISEGVEAAEDLTKDNGRGEGFVLDGAVDVCAEVGEDFAGEVTDGFGGAFEGLSGVAAGEGEAEVLTGGFPWCAFSWGEDFGCGRRLSVGV